jgi:hypothetical protein
MLDVTTEAVRVSRGLVLWVVAGQTRGHCYEPSPEGLLWEWWSKGVGSGVYLDGIELPVRTAAECQLWRPCYWHRVGIPGSGGKKWLRADVEYVLCFKGNGNEFWTENTACGHPPKCKPGGKFSHFTKDGKRVNTIIASGERRMEGEQQRYIPPSKVNPGNYHEWEFAEVEAEWHERAVIDVIVGGGHFGSDLAHKSEAPYPESLVEFFVRSFAPPGGLILDPFSGSGTSAAVAVKHNRRAIGLDLRRSQSELGHDSLRPRSPLDPPRPLKPLDGQGDLFAVMEATP